jgi:hypothetical protein
MTREAVAAAIDQVKARDRALGADAEVAAQWLTAGEGTDMLYQAAVQRFLWFTLPPKFPPTTWRSVIAGTAALLDQLGLRRYAGIARGDETCDILDAWDQDDEAGRKRSLAAHVSSGVNAPDTELVRWGSVMGIDEARAQESVERALEAAIVAGELTPGSTGWKQTATRICKQTLTHPLADPGGQTLLTRLTTERVASWITNTHVKEHRRGRDRVSRQLLTPIPPPAGMEPIVGPMRWLLERTANGTSLTQNGYLARTLVLEAVDRFDWWQWDKPPRSEVDVHQLCELRAVASGRRLIRRTGRRLIATAKGTRMLADTERLWRELAGTLGGHDEYGQIVAELAGLRMLETVTTRDDLTASIAPILLGQGWRTNEGPITERNVDDAIGTSLYWWRLLGLIREDVSPTRPSEPSDQFKPTDISLTEGGAATVLAYLRDRATGPRHGVFD